MIGRLRGELVYKQPPALMVFHRCVAEGNVKALTRLPGIGKKTAERLVVEMRDRLDRLFGDAGPREEAVQALEALGYRSGEAEKLVRAVASDDMDSQAIIRAALRASLK